MIARAYILFGTALLFATGALAQDKQDPGAGQVIQPEIDRRDIVVPKIDSENFEISAFTGILSVEDFGSKSVSGFRAAYHLSEDVFIEASYAESKVSDETFFDRGSPVFTQREVDLEYANVSIGWNLLPGETFIGERRVWSSAVYVLGGIGRTKFSTVDSATINLGLGLRVIPVDWFSLRFELRDHLFEADIVTENEIKHNFELSLGLSVFF